MLHFHLMINLSLDIFKPLFEQTGSGITVYLETGARCWGVELHSYTHFLCGASPDLRTAESHCSVAVIGRLRTTVAQGNDSTSCIFSSTDETFQGIWGFKPFGHKHPSLNLFISDVRILSPLWVNLLLKLMEHLHLQRGKDTNTFIKLKTSLYKTCNRLIRFNSNSKW